ncbi:MAG: hypothetical protein ACYSSP_09050 [Planctomycetota bacterium]|jgi:hypothetical protein
MCLKAPLYSLVFIILFLSPIDDAAVIPVSSIVLLTAGAVIVAVRGLFYLRKL